MMRCKAVSTLADWAPNGRLVRYSIRPAWSGRRGAHVIHIEEWNKRSWRGKKSSGSTDRFVAFVSLGLGAAAPIIAYCNCCTNNVHALDFYCQWRARRLLLAASRLSFLFYIHTSRFPSGLEKLLAKFTTFSWFQQRFTYLVWSCVGRFRWSRSAQTPLTHIVSGSIH